MRRQAVGRRFSPLDQPHNVQNQRAKRGVLGQLGRDRKGAVERDARVEERRKLLREKQDVAALTALKRGKTKRRAALLFEADVNRNQALTLELLRDVFIGIRAERAGAEFAVGRNGTEMK